MPKHYEYLKDGVVYGPVTGKQIRHLAAAGQISPNDLIRTTGADGGGKWVRAGKVRGLQFAEPSSAVAEPPSANPLAPAPLRPTEANTLPGPMHQRPSDSLPALDPRAEIMDDSPRPTRSRSGIPIWERLLAIFWGIIGFFCAFPVGCSSTYMACGGQDIEQSVHGLLVGLGCLFILFASIFIRSFRVRAW